MMRKLLVSIIVATWVAGAWADDEDLLNDATVKALELARISLEQSGKVEGVKLIGVATLEGDEVNASRLAKTVLTKTRFDVVLTDDKEWGPLLDEFARQKKREQIIDEATRYELNAKGVDAVLYGAVEKALVETVEEKDRQGRQATVRMLLNLASLSEGGKLIWSEQLTGIAEDVAESSAETKVLVFAKEYRLFLVAAAVVVALLVLWRMYKVMVTPR